MTEIICKEDCIFTRNNKCIRNSITLDHIDYGHLGCEQYLPIYMFDMSRSAENISSSHHFGVESLTDCLDIMSEVFNFFTDEQIEHCKKLIELEKKKKIE